MPHAGGIASSHMHTSALARSLALSLCLSLSLSLFLSLPPSLPPSLHPSQSLDTKPFEDAGEMYYAHCRTLARFFGWLLDLKGGMGMVDVLLGWWVAGWARGGQ